ncbi:MAG: hypothetical protein RIB32_02810 [Phycisphaerales bacterium]
MSHRTRIARLCLTVLCALAASASGQMEDPEPCLLYVEGFGSFGGPANYDDGAFRVEWCESGASIASGSFCPTGNALKLDTSAEDPMLWLYLGGQGCGQVRLTFQFSQFSDTGTFLTYQPSMDETLDCGAVMTQVAGALNVTGGQCITAVHTVNVAGVNSVYWKFDHGVPNGNAIFIDTIFVELLDCGCAEPSHDCCEIGAAGCIDQAVQDCVCAMDPYCCDVEWDEQCVAQVELFGCGDCGGAGPGCDTEFEADFGTFFQSGRVCELFPELFEFCEGVTGPFISSSPACAGPGDYAMTFASGFPYSAAVTKCLDLSIAATWSLEFTYSKPSTIGPRIEISVDDGPFSTIWSAPFAATTGCETACVDLSPYAGLENVRLKFSSGGSSPGATGIDDITLIPGTVCLNCESPTVDAGPDIAVCAIGASVMLTGSVTGGDGGLCPGDADVLWTGPGVILDADTLTPTVTQAGTYTLQAFCGDCVASDTVVLAVETGPVVNAGPDRTLPCGGGIIEIQASAGGCAVGPTGNYLWTTDDGNIIAGATGLRARIDAPGVYVFTATCTDSGCTRQDVVVVSETSVPGDADGNLTVDFADLNAILQQWGQTVAPGEGADLTGDGAVDFDDLNIILQNWGDQCV